MADDTHYDEILEQVARHIYRSAMRAMSPGGSRPIPPVEMRIFRSGELFGQEAARVVSARKLKDDDVALSPQEQIIFDRLSGRMALLGAFDLARKTVARGLLNDGYAVPGGGGKSLALVLYNDHRASGADLLSDIAGLALPAGGLAGNLRASDLAMVHFVHKSLLALYRAEPDQQSRELMPDNDAHFFLRAAGYHLLERIPDLAPLLHLRNAYILKAFSSNFEPMAAVGGLIPRDIMQAAQAETIAQLVHFAHPTVSRSFVEGAIEERTAPVAQAIRDNRLDPFETAWNLRVRENDAAHAGLALNTPMSMLPLVGELLAWQFNTRGGTQVTEAQAQVVNEVFSADTDPATVYDIDREKLYTTLPLMLLAKYARAAQELFGPQAEALLSDEARDIVGTLLELNRGPRWTPPGPSRFER